MQLNRIKQALKELGLSQVYLKNKLAEKIQVESVSKSYINKLCNNKTQPSLTRLFEIAEIMGVPAYTLIGDYDPKKVTISKQHQKELLIKMIQEDEKDGLYEEE